MVNRERREGRAQSSCGEEEGRNAEVSGMCQDFDLEVPEGVQYGISLL